MEPHRIDPETLLARDLLDAIHLGAAILDAQGELLHINPLGRELHDMGAFDFRHDAGITDSTGVPLPTSDSPLARIRAGEPVTDLRVRLVPRDGAVRNLSFHAHPVGPHRDDACVLLLVSEQAEDEAAHHARKGPAGIEAFNHVCHDLRTPIRALAGFSQILQEDHAESLPPPARNLLDRIEHSALKIANLLEDILRLSCISEGACLRGSLDLAVVAREHLADSAPGMTVELRAPAQLPAWGDERLLRLALGNLLNNALKFSPNRSPVVVELGREQPYGAFFVRDEGIGFDPALAHDLFIPFCRLPNAEAFEGTGLGLAIARQVIERHGGSLWADAAPGGGATFFFTLPERSAPRDTSLPRAIR